MQHGRAGRAYRRHELLKKRLEKPQVGKYHFHPKIHIRGYTAEHLQHSRVKFTGKGIVLFHIRHKFTQTDKRCIFPRRAGMAAFAPGDKLQVAVTLFQNPHHGIGPFHAADGFFHNHAAFIYQKCQLYSLLLQISNR